MLVEFGIKKFHAAMIIKKISELTKPPEDTTSIPPPKDDPPPDHKPLTRDEEEKVPTTSHVDINVSYFMYKFHLQREKSAFKDEDVEMIDTSTNQSSASNTTNFISSGTTNTSAVIPPPSFTHLEKFKKEQKKTTSLSSVTEARTNYLLYQSYVDYSSEYKMFKIKLHNEDFIELIKDINFDVVQVIGLYGSYIGCLKIAEAYLNKSLPENLQSFEEGILSIKHENKIAFIYKTAEDIYDYKKGTDSTLQVSTFIRYLVDICEIIVCVPPVGLEINSDLKNPF